MDWEKIRNNSVKATVLILNVLLAAGGVYYFKNKDQQKKEAKIAEEKKINEEILRYNADAIQEAVVSWKEEAQRSIADNPETLTREEIVKVEKYIPPVTKEVKVTETKEVKGGKSSKTTSSS